VPAADTLAALDGIPPESIPAALAHLTARLLAAPPAPAEDPADELLTPQEAARLLKTNVRFVQRHARALGGARISARKWRFPARKVRRWLEARQAA
jgi:excisionase family DNA binding protein